jgi:hypothetical protein
MVEPYRSHVTIQYGRAIQVTCNNTVYRLHFTEARIQIHVQNIYYLLFFCGNKCYANMPQCYSTCTLPVLLLGEGNSSLVKRSG